jgi:hypothetical protein
MINIDELGISGVVGYSILINPSNNKIIVLLADIHDGVEYCNKHTEKNIYIDQILNKLLDRDDLCVELEEVPREGLKLVELWPNAVHTQRLKKWFLENQTKILPIDIRPYLIPFSFQKYDLNILEDMEKNMKMDKYLQTLDSLFFLNNIPLKKSIVFFKNIIESLETKTEQSGILKMYKILKEKYIGLKTQIKITNTFEETIKENKSWFEKLEELKLNIMDWYTTLLLLRNCHHICHFGLAHYLNVKAILETNFKFKKIYETSNSSKLEILKSCIKIL